MPMGDLETAGSLYRRDPLEIVDDIPVFSPPDRYVKNYERIAHDHVSAMSRGIENPFMDPVLWRTSEDSTRLLIREHVNPGSLVLDVGVGLGRLLGPLGEYKRHGIDISLDYLGEARKAGIDVAFARIEDMPYRDAVFDAAVCCDVLEHVLDLHFCTAEILRAVKPQGLIIVRVPFRESLEGYLDEASPYEFVHLRNFDLESLKLHFTRIFDCKWIAHSFAAPYLGDVNRLRVRSLPSTSALRAVARKLPRFRLRRHPLAPLAKICAFTDQEILEWLRELQHQSPDQYAKLVDELVVPLEVNVVLRKK